ENMSNIRSNIHDHKASTILAECSFDPVGYNEIAARYGIQHSNVSSLMLTTEYPGLVKSGGIGTFVADWHRSNNESAVLAAFDFDKEKSPKGDSVISASDLVDPSKIELAIHDTLLEALIQFVFMFPDLKEVHFQEYLGIGMRISQ